MSHCLFCNMVAGHIAADIVYETDDVLAFNDINPQAPTHILIIPKKHIATVNEIEANDIILIGQLYTVAKEIAREKKFDEAGYRLVMNCNRDAGQTVFHLHLHLLAGRVLTWPPG